MTNSSKTSAPIDVRMQGFPHRTAVDTAIKWIDQQTKPLSAEIVAYDQALGRILKTDLSSALDVPAFDRSAMDGFALRGTETVGASDYHPLNFRVIGESLPGHPFQGKVETGTAVQIMTGAPLPEGADAVIPVEYVQVTNDCLEITTAVPPLKHVGQRGEDLTQGDLLLPAGRQLRPQDLALLASVGITEVSVVRKPQVRLVITGDELVLPGEKRGPFQIFESNSVMLKSLITRDAGIVESIHFLSDDPIALKQVLTQPGADLILISGGSSVGREDHAPRILAEHGELVIHGIAMRPSSPTGMGRLGDAIVFLLPGNPVSCLCAYDFFAGRALRRYAGKNSHWPYPVTSGTVQQKIVSQIGRVDYCRVSLENQNITPIALSGASILSSTTKANAFVIVPESSEGYAPGTVLEVYLYDIL